MLSENGANLERTVLVAIPTDRAPDEHLILEMATKLRAAFPVNDQEFEDVIRTLHSKLAIQMDIGTVLTEIGHKPWLFAKKPSIDPFYWERFKQLLQKREWPPLVISTLDRVTDEILDLLQDPSTEGIWKRRGLVIGDVQSGKTATYTALCCKAADAGYRLIILLTGTLEMLRRQTQERLDEGFVGLDSSGLLTQIRRTRAVGVGLHDARRAAGVFTSRERDFSRSLLTTLGFRLDAFKEPVLLVVKKNKKILENLANWLSEFNSNRKGKIESPLLLIDDEADSASVNTNPANTDPTQINQRIRGLLSLFTRSSYIGFTATPFANIFIDPETEHEMLGDDLFPRDFIFTLDPPTNYVGPVAIFGEEPRKDLKVIEKIEDAYDIFPIKHKQDLAVDMLPQSLIEALQCFLLANVIRDLRGEGQTHRSMLVNVSRFTAVQDKVASLVHERLATIQQDIRNYSQLPPMQALKNSTISAIHDVWTREYSNTEFDWPEVQKSLLTSALPVTVKAVNQRTGAASLDYAVHKDAGLRVIAVGGNSLSRGLTLEGLCVSYFFRNSQMYDTLLQMGRWFGYRDGYEGLCRLWLTDEAAQWYAHITAATEELREEVKRMRSRNATPKEFGLKVRAHPDTLLVTAQNKMRQARTIERVISLSAKLLETTRLRENVNLLNANRNAVLRFLEQLHQSGVKLQISPWGHPLWKSVPKERIAQLLLDFDVHPLSVTFQADHLANFLQRTHEPLLREWDVAIPTGDGPQIKLGAVSVTTEERSVIVREGMIVVSGTKARVGSRGAEREGMDPETVRRIELEYRATHPKKSVPDLEYRLKRLRPLLLIHPLYAKENALGAMSDQVLALGLSFPHFDDSDVAQKVKYTVNLVEWKAMLENEIDDDVDDEDGDGR